jgi:hypothetical protein
MMAGLALAAQRADVVNIGCEVFDGEYICYTFLTVSCGPSVQANPGRSWIA